MSNGEAEALLVGSEIEAVVFIRDYVQLQLYKPSESLGLTFVNDPVVTRSGVAVTNSMEGWRDALCAFIGRTIEMAAIDGERMSLNMGDDKLEVSLDQEHGPESALLRAGDRLWVW